MASVENEAYVSDKFEIHFLSMDDYAGVVAASNWTEDVDATEGTVYAKTFNISGGDVEVESEPYFGGSYLTFTKPRNPITITMDVRFPTSVADKHLWETMMFGANIDSAGRPVPQIIGIRATLPDASTKTAEFKNAVMTGFEPTFESADYWQASVTFQVAPTDGTGAANVDYNDPTFVK